MTSAREAFDDIPLRDAAVYQRISAGRTAGVFQLSGAAMRRGCQDLKPRKMEDLIAAQALFRPATMKSGATKEFIARRFKLQEVPMRHQHIMTETANTHGVLLYQEQVINVLKAIGMTPDRLSDMLTAVKASNELSKGATEELEKARPEIEVLAKECGWDDNDITWLLEAIVAYGEYSFNRAHAASYAMTAYKTAWLATHHPLEFWYGVICAYEGHKMEMAHIASARRDGVVIRRAHVNSSGVSYRIDGNTIRSGLIAIQGIGVSTAMEIERHQPYSSLRCFAEKVNPRKVTGTYKLLTGASLKECGGAVAALASAGALEGMPDDDG